MSRIFNGICDFVNVSATTVKEQAKQVNEEEIANLRRKLQEKMTKIDEESEEKKKAKMAYLFSMRIVWAGFYHSRQKGEELGKPLDISSNQVWPQSLTLLVSVFYIILFAIGKCYFLLL